MTQPNIRFGSSHGARTEDEALLTGRARFSNDVQVPGSAHAVFVRSPHGHARIVGIDSSTVRSLPGVIDVITGADVVEAGLGSIPTEVVMPGKEGRPMVAPAMPVLAADRARYVGEPVAVIVAETAAQAQDAADLLEVEYESLPAAATVELASAPDAPVIWPEAPGNVSLDWAHGDHAAVEAGFGQAAHRVRLQVRMPPVSPCALEPRAAIAEWDEQAGRYTLVAGTQGVAVVSKILARSVFHVEPSAVHVKTYDVGGGFGMKVQAYAEYAALLFAARRCGRPVRWCASRLESFLTDTHGRDGILDGELALDKSGRFLALRVRSLVGIGAYASTYVAIVATNNTKNCLSSVYRIPAIHMDVKLMLTNASPLGPYRGAGRPEAIYLLERLIEEAARVTGIDRVELRRRNLIPPEAIPYAAPSGQTYDSGEFEAVLDKALALSDWNGFAARRAQSEREGRLRGIGLCCFLEVSGGAPLTETADLRIDADGRIVLRTGAQAMGQGLATTQALLVSRLLGVDPARVGILHGDSAEVPVGIATVASRSTAMAGGAAHQAVSEMLEKGRNLAAEALEAAPADIEYAAGSFRVIGTDRGISLEEVGRDGALDTVSVFSAPEMNFPNGCHVCEVEVDPDTGAVRVVAYTAVDDVGNMINPTLVEGQIHGAVAQGLGQVLGEAFVYDESGQLLTGSFMDYRVLRADDMPPLRLAHHVVPCTTNPAGVKGAGESGIAGSIPSAACAVLDALSSRGVTHLDLPLTSERVWAALNRGG
jgi:carbon-monoxide dehydrogenase large subunit